MIRTSLFMFVTAMLLIEAPSAVANLPSISKAVPISFGLTFNAD